MIPLLLLTCQVVIQRNLWGTPPSVSLALWYNLLVKVFRNLFEAISSLERGKALVSNADYLFNPRLAFYQEDIFGDLALDKYKNLELSYGVLGRYISEFLNIYEDEEDEIDQSKDEGEYVNMGIVSHSHREFDRISSNSLFVRSDDFLSVLGKLDDSVKDLKSLDEKLVGFLKSSGKTLSSLASSFDFIVFSNFKENQYRDEENLLISGIYEGKNTPRFSEFWKNIMFSNSGTYEKLLSVFDEDFRKYVLTSIDSYKNKSDSFSLPFGLFSADTRFLFLDKNNLGKGVGLVSIDRRLSHNDISERFTRFLTSRRDIPLSILGCLDIYYFSGPKLEEKNIVLIPVELKKDGRKILVLHTFLVVNLLDDYFRFYVDVRSEGSLYTDYKIRLYPNKDGEDSGRLVLNVLEKIGLDIEGLYGMNLRAVASFKTTSVGELVEVGGNKELVPRGLTLSHDSLVISVYDFSANMDEKFYLSPQSPYEGELLSLFKDSSGRVLKGRGYAITGSVWKSTRFVNAIGNIISSFESKFFSDLFGSCFLSSEGEKYSYLRDKEFLKKMVELIFRESFEFIKSVLDKCEGFREKCDLGVYVDIDEESYRENAIRITEIRYRPNLIRGWVPPKESKGYLKKIFEERALYSKFIDSFDQSGAKLCFDSKGNKVEIDIDLPLQEDKVKYLLKRSSYLGFINWSLRNVEEIREDQAELYSVFLDLVPYDPNSVRFLHFKGVYNSINSKLGKFIRNFEEALEQGSVHLNIDLTLGLKVTEKENKICILPSGGSYFVPELIVGSSFTYKKGKSLLEIVVYDSY